MEKVNNIFVDLNNLILGWLSNLGLPNFINYSIITTIYFVIIVIFILTNVLILVWMERRVSAAFQERLGPNRVGPAGLFQTFNDAIKLLGKEIISPQAVDKRIYLLAPLFILTTAVVLYTLIPFGKGMTIANVNVGVFFFIAISSTTTVSILMAGWGSNNKYSLLGGMRAVAQIISYEIPLAFSMLGVIMIVGSLNLNDIVNAQKNVWFIFLQPLSFLILFIVGTAELNRAPFDLPESEQELVAGFHTEYTGMRFALFFIAEYANLFSISALIATLYLGGWQGPLLPSWLWLILKVYFVVFLFMWIRWTYPRVRIDKMMNFNWKYLIPLSIANILLTGIGIKLYQTYLG